MRGIERRHPGGPGGDRRSRRGFTLMEVSLGLTIVVFSLLAMSASTLRTGTLRKQNRDRAVAQNAVRLVVESIHGLSDDLRADPPAEFGTWSAAIVAALSEGGTLGTTFAVPELRTLPNEEFVGSIEILTDETLTDAALGVDIGMPRDLDGDGDAADSDVTGTARLHPVIVTVTWQGSTGEQTLRQPFYVVGY